MTLELEIGYNNITAEININASYVSESSGTVKSVNNELPDVNGNVTIVIPDPDLSGLATTQALTDGLDLKVDKVAGKSLTTNDYTNSERDKLLPFSFAASNQIDLSHPNGISEIVLTSNLDFTPITDTAIENFTHRIKIDLNGFTPTFSGFTLFDENTRPDETAGKINIIYFIKSADVYFYIIFASYTGTIANTSGVSETFSLVDNQSAVLQTLAAMNESFSLTDTQNAFIVSDTQLIGEIFSLTDTQTATVNYAVTVNETFSLSDTEEGTIIAAPTFVSAATSTDGLTIGVIYSKTMPASPTYSGMSFSGTTSGTHAATGATRDGSNTSKVNYTIASACVNGETITANYTAGNIVANDGGILADFSSQAVTNNVTAAYTYYIPDTLSAATFSESTHEMVATGTNAYGINTAISALSGDGEIVMDCLTALNQTGNAVIGLDTTNANASLNSYEYYLMQVTTGVVRYKKDGAITDSPYFAISGDMLRLRRLSNVIYFELYHSGSWTEVTTATVTGTVYMRLVVTAAVGNYVKNARYING